MTLQESPEHVSLVALKVLTARLIALPIFKRANPTGVDGELLRRFCINVSEVDMAGCAPQLSGFLRDRLKSAETYASGLTAPEQATLSARLAALRTAVTKVSCAKCAGPKGHRCNVNSPRRNDLQIDRTGLCLSVFRQMHSYVVQMLTAVFQTWVPDEILARDDFLPHRWGTVWAADARRQVPTGTWKVGGSTEFLDSGNSRMSQVQLVLNVEELDWDSLLAVVWVFTHELFCHVSQVATSDRQPRRDCRPSCQFFEGWMDKVAYWVLEADQALPWCKGQSPFVTRHRDEILQAASAYRQERYGIGPGSNRPSMVAQWELGVETVRTVRQFLEITSPQADEGVRRRIALGQLVKLSFRIQKVGQRPQDLDAMLSALMLASSLQLEGGHRDRRRRLVELLTGPIENKSLWVKELSDLSIS